MHLPFLFLLPITILSCSPHYATSSSPPNVLTQGSSLSVENNNDILVSPNKLFTAGFHQVGQNAYCFAIWFSEPMSDGNHTLVWMANRDEPVNGKRSKLSLLKTGNLVLTDAGRQVWRTNTKSTNSQLKLCQRYVRSFDFWLRTRLPESLSCNCEVEFDLVSLSQILRPASVRTRFPVFCKENLERFPLTGSSLFAIQTNV